MLSFVLLLEEEHKFNIAVLFLMWFRFVCGFDVSFAQIHLPASIIDEGLDPILGAWSIGFIGLLNIAGSFLSGWSGKIFAETECAFRNICDQGNRNMLLCSDAFKWHKCYSIFSSYGPFMAIYSSFDNRISCPDTRPEVSFHTRGSSFLQSPSRGISRCLGGGAPV